jgi:predicted PurR-regulated permease PerM
MKKEYFIVVLFFLLTGIFFYLFYKMMVPFVAPVAWGGILAIIFFPLYRRLGSKIKSRNLAALVTSIVVIFILIGPALYLMIALVGEASNAFAWIDNAQKTGEIKNYYNRVLPFLESIRSRLYGLYPDLANIDFDALIKDAIGKISGYIGAKATAMIADITKTVFQFFLTLFSMFFFFRDGDKLISFLKRLTPLDEPQVATTYLYLKEVVQGAMYGGLLMALIQGALGGILFAIMGIYSPVFWGAVMAFSALIPVLGPFIIYIPAGLILILGGSYVKGILLIAIGSAVISQIDNFVRPFLFAGKTQMHTLLLFFSIMGGIFLFGLVGMVLGPLITAVFLMILKIFEAQIRPEASLVDYLSDH